MGLSDQGGQVGTSFHGGLPCRLDIPVKCTGKLAVSLSECEMCVVTWLRNCGLRVPDRPQFPGVSG
jgi:hypothetical protein